MSVLALPAPVDAFLKKPNAAVIGFVRPDGFPMTVVTWYDWYRHVSLWGVVVEIRDDSGLGDIDRLALRYTGKPFGNRTGRRVSAWIEPRGWHGWDDSGEQSSAPA